jgi:hypothetical protein
LKNIINHFPKKSINFASEKANQAASFLPCSFGLCKDTHFYLTKKEYSKTNYLFLIKHDYGKN